MSFNPKLFECASYAIGQTKLAFVPGGDPAAMGAAPPGGAPPMDPAAMAGAAPPPPAADPAAAAAGAPPAPPADPAAAQPGAGAPPAPAPAPPAGGMDPEMIRSIIREEMAQGGAGGQKPKGPKITPEQMYQESVRTRKMITHMFGLMNWGLPPDILNDDIPNDQQGGGKSSGGGGGGGGGSSGGQSKSAIAPIKPLGGAFPMGKVAGHEVTDAADALLRLLKGG